MASEKWSREKCERHFIEDPDGVSIRQLETLSKRSKTTILRWSQEGDWQFKREQFQKSLAEVSRQKSIDKLSDLLSDRCEALLRRHFEAADQILEIVEMRSSEERYRLQQMKHQVETGQRSREDLLDAVRSISPFHLEKLTQSLERLIDLQRQAVGLAYFQDLNVSMKALDDAGYVVLERSQYAEVVGKEPFILEAS